jgi:hypothetical protein
MKTVKKWFDDAHHRQAKWSFIIVSLMILLISSICSLAMAATPAEIEQAIDSGISWLVAQQQGDGSWSDPSYGEPVACTGFAVTKLADRAFELGYTPFDQNYPYKDAVENGLNFIFQNGFVVDIYVQPAGNPDTDGDGKGVQFGDEYRTIYSTGICMMAIAATRAPNRVVGSIGSEVDGWTYKQVLNDAVDFMAFAQTDTPNAGRGGWRYRGQDPDADNSNSGYAVLGLGYAESCAYGFNCAVPQFVKDELNIYIDFIQCDSGYDDGSSGYTWPCDLPNVLKTGNLIFEMEFVGRDSEEPDVQRALAYIGRKWNDPSQDPGWGNPAYGGAPHCQAMFCTMRGLEYAGIDTIVVDGSPRDWYADFADALVNAQQSGGYWPADPYGGNVLATEWALLTLEKLAPAPCPVELTKVDDVSNCIGPGDYIVYTIDYNYPSDANCLYINDVNIIDELPDEVDYNSSDPCGIYDPCSHTVMWNIGTLHSGDAGTVTLKVKVKCAGPGGTITNYCEIKSGNQTLGFAYEYTPVCSPTLTKVDNIPNGNCVGPGDYITYNICYDANGYGDTNVVIIDYLPGGVNYISSDPCGAYNPVSHTVTWDINFPPDACGCIKLVVQVNTMASSGGIIANRCEIKGDCIDIDEYEGTPACCWMEIPVVYVDADANGYNNGTSWKNAYNYLQDALLAARNCDYNEIRVAQGTYRPDEDATHPDGNNSRYATFQLIDGVAIKGNYAGFGQPDPDARNIRRYETILSGDLKGNDREGVDPCDLLTDPCRADNSYHVVTGSGTYTAVLDGFTIMGGNANGDDAPGDCGGGMYNYGGSLTVRNCTFRWNSAGAGGGIYNYSHLTVSNCTFSENSASDGYADMCSRGGGIYNVGNYNNIRITNCLFKNNWTDGWGGGLCCNENEYFVADADIINCTFVGNGDGGILYVCGEGGTATVTNCILWGNEGRQIQINHGSASVTYSDVEGGYEGTGNIDADPMFADADGPDNIFGTEDDNLWLLPGSPCIDAGDNTAVPEGVVTDLDGHPRFINDPKTSDTGNGTPPIVDMGAYEYNEYRPIIYKVDDVNDDDCVGPGDEINYRIDYNYPAGPNYINFEDLAYFVQWWLADDCASNNNCNEMDMNTDGTVNFIDFALFASNWLEGQIINDVNIIDYLPTEVDFNSASVGGVYDSNSRTVTWNLDTLSPGESGFVTLKVNVKAPESCSTSSTIRNTCEIRSGEQILTSVYEYTPVCWASDPRPSCGATDVPLDAVLLNWTAGKYAADVNGHRVYFDDVEDNVKNRNGCDVNGVSTTDPYYGPLATLDLGKTYYWAVDEVNDACAPCLWEGDVWSFTTLSYFVVENFNSYANTEPELIAVWKDYVVNGTKAEIALQRGSDDASLVRDGNSMQYAYRNNYTPYYSEAYAETTGANPLPSGIGANWLATGAKALVLWFRGDTANIITSHSRMYVILTDGDSPSHNATVQYNGDINDIKVAAWHEWSIKLTDFTDVNLANVKRITIGFGDKVKDPPQNRRYVYFDDIRLYVPGYVPELVAGDLEGDCVVNFRDFAMLANEWLDMGCCDDLYKDDKVDFKDLVVMAVEEG